MKTSVNAYAKINLFLDIVSLRNDGYHNILSIMQSVGLHDVITVDYDDSRKEKTITILCDNASIPCDERNLAYKAADLLIECGHITITIEKNIPSEAGLAGGSADAAATLVAINQILGDKYSIDELKTIGKKLGADVPFCIEGGCCIVEGIGDRMTKCLSMPKLPLVIARMGEGMSTPYAYRKLDEKFNNFENYIPNSKNLDILLDSTKPLESYCQGLFNIFEDVVESERQTITEIKEVLINNGAYGSLMTGSGTAVFGIFDNAEKANIAAEKLKNIGAFACVCYPR